jgi:hypothetical protein
MAEADRIPPPQPLAQPPVLSPFLAEQEAATRRVLAQVQPDLSISRSALTILLRLQDACAHILLSRAFKGLNPPQRPGQGPDSDPSSQPDASNEAFALQDADPTHAVHFVFPAGVGLRAVARHAEEERSKAVFEFLVRDPAEDDSGAPSPDSFQFTRKIAHRWWSDFHKGIEQSEDGEVLMVQARRRQAEKDELEEKRTGRRKKKVKGGSGAAALDAAASEESKEKEKEPSYPLLPDVLQAPLEQISLLSMVEYLCAELIEIAGQRALDRDSRSLHVLDLWVACAQDAEIRGLVHYLNVSWYTRDVHLGPPLNASKPAANAPAASFGLPTLDFILGEEFSSALDAMADVNKTSWYQTASTVAEYAIKFARGEMQLSPMQRSLQELQVRPLQFLGRDERTVLCDKPPSEEFPSPREAFSFVKFSIADAKEREWTFLLEIAPFPSWKACLNELDYAGTPLGLMHRVTRNRVDTLRIDFSNAGSIGDAAGHTYEPRQAQLDEVELEIVREVKLLKERLDAHRKKMAAEHGAPWEDEYDEHEIHNSPTVAAHSSDSTSLTAASSGPAAASSSTSLPADTSFSLPAPDSLSLTSLQTALEEVVPNAMDTSDDTPAEMAILNAAFGIGAEVRPQPSAVEEEKTSAAVSSSAGVREPAAEETKQSDAGASSAASVAPASSSSSAAASSSASASSFDPFAIFAPAAPPVAKPKSASFRFNPVGRAAAAAAAAAIAAGATEDEAPSPVPPALAKPPVISFGHSRRLDGLSSLLGSVSVASENTQIQTELESIVSRILFLPFFSKYGPTLYADNHPPAVKRAFTVALIDEAMALAPSCGAPEPLPELPIVLLDISQC